MVPNPRPRATDNQRNALAPGILAAIVLLAGIALLTHEYYLAVRFVVAILAIIIGWFAIQARQWWWAPVMLAIAVLWNPVYPLTLDEGWAVGAHVVGAVVFLVAGVLITSPRAAAAESGTARS